MSEVGFDPVLLGLELSAIAVVYAIAVLTALALVIKILTKVLRPKVKAVEAAKEVPESGSGLRRGDEDHLYIALAAVALHRYLSEKVRTAQVTTPRVNSWVHAWRIEHSMSGGYIDVRDLRYRRR